MRTKYWGIGCAACTALAALPWLVAASVGCSGANDALQTTDNDAAPSVSSTRLTSSDAGVDATVDSPSSLEDASDAQPADVVEAGPPSLCTGVNVCDDFETTAAGSVPNPALWAITSPNCTGRGTAVVDDAMAYTGHHSVKVVNDFGDAGSPQYCDHVFFSNDSAFAVTGPEQVYTRFFVTLGDPLGTTHVTFAMTNTRDTTPNVNQLRLGFDDGVFSWNYPSNNTFLPELQGGPTGNTDPIEVMESLPPPSGWFCVEFHIDESAGTIETWVQSMAVPGLEFDGSAVTNVSTQWAMTPLQPALNNLGFGWETYNGMPMNLWFDDVAIDTKRIGCTAPDQ